MASRTKNVRCLLDELGIRHASRSVGTSYSVEALADNTTISNLSKLNDRHTCHPQSLSSGGSKTSPPRYGVNLP
jgi:hypothetical protein